MNSRKYFLLTVVGVLFFYGCKVMEPQPLPAVTPMPAQFDTAIKEQDTFALEFSTFFPDPYLVELIDSALKNNNDLNIALQRISRAEARLTARKGAMLPSVDAVVSGGGERYGDYTMNGVGNFDTNLSPNIKEDQRIPTAPTTDMFVGLRSSWEIDLWGKLRHREKAAAAGLMATREARQLIVTNLVANLSHHYYELLAFDAELEIVKKNIALQEEELEIVKAQQAGGRATKLAVQQFAAQVLNTKAIRYHLLQSRAEVENEISLLLGKYPGHVARDTSLPGPARSVTIRAGLPASLLLRRPDIRQAEHVMEAAKENVQAARAAFLPSLVITPYLGLNAFTPGLLFNGGSAAYGLVGGLTGPLFHQRALRSQYTIANAENREAVYAYQQRLLEAYTEVVTRLSAVQNLRHSYNTKLQEVQQLSDAVVTARDLYLSGYANYLEVIMAQKSVLEAELELVNQKRDIFLALVQLYRSLGGGWK